MNTCAVVLAAGEGKRMRSKYAKVVHRAAGKPLVCWVRDALTRAGAREQVYIVGHRQEQVRAILGEDVAFVLQDQLLGTGHAVMQASQFLEGRDGATFVMCADAPLVRPETLAAVQKQFEMEDCAAVLITAEAADPFGYGRVVRNDHGEVCGIVEEKDANPDEKQIHEINSGMYLFNTALLLSVIGKIGCQNNQNEYYLTDTIAALIEEGHRVSSFKAEYEETLGVNDRLQLQQASAVLNKRILEDHMKQGVTIIDPEQVWIEPDVRIGQDVVIWPGCHISGKTVIADDCVIGPDTSLTDVEVGQRVHLEKTTAKKCRISQGCMVGPYVHIRANSDIGAFCRIGNFAEIKNARLGPHCQISHQCYIGDADIGERVTIGSNCSVANYDGIAKNRTIVGSFAFVGSNCSLVSPVHIKEYAYVAAGSVVTEDVPQYALAIGRARQINKEEWVLRRKNLRNKG